MGTLGLNLEDSCWKTSASSGWCFSSFLIFMILTIAACGRRDSEQDDVLTSRAVLQVATHSSTLIKISVFDDIVPKYRLLSQGEGDSMLF